MKVAIGCVVKDGPWGGGNQFARSLLDAVTAAGHDAVFDLADDDIDIALMVDPRRSHPSVTFRARHLLDYLSRNPRCLVVHRINECDERKGTRTMNLRLKLANYVADHTVFIGSWLRDLDLWRRGDGGSSVILNGADHRVFNAHGHHAWDGSGPLRLVTHHWGANEMKGFDVYRLLDSLMGQPEWQGRLEFTYIGNLPQGFAFTHARAVAPLAGQALADALRSHHAYVTASINEPAGMHHIEGAMCGLPLLYRMSGALPEYCQGFGEGFNGPEDFAAALRRLMAGYAQWNARMPAYDRTATAMSAGYLALFEDLVARRDAIVARRRPWRDPLARILNKVVP